MYFSVRHFQPLHRWWFAEFITVSAVSMPANAADNQEFTIWIFEPTSI